jgi:hypothetical protein
MLDGSTFSGQRQWGVAFTYPNIHLSDMVFHLLKPLLFG